MINLSLSTDELIDAVNRATNALDSHMQEHGCIPQRNQCKAQQALRDEQLTWITKLCERKAELERRVLSGL
jgi:hypothetical protein